MNWTCGSTLYAYGRAYYVASRASNPARPAMWRKLRDERKYNIVSSWIDEIDKKDPISLSLLWFKINQEIQQCDTLVLYAEADDFPLKGAFVEVGMALALEKNVIVVLPDINPDPDTCAPIGSWIKHNRVRVVKTIDEAFE